MTRLTTIELHKESMKFASGHFTIFSATEREKLHGHNFTVSAQITAVVSDNGIAFDYDIYKHRIVQLCKQLGHLFLLAGKSPHSTIDEQDEYYIVHFNGEKIPFLKQDALIMPLANITVEDLALWFLEQLTQSEQELKKHSIEAMTIKVYSAPGQCGSCSWLKD